MAENGLCVRSGQRTKDGSGEPFPVEPSCDTCRKLTLRSSSWSGVREEAFLDTSALMRLANLDREVELNLDKKVIELRVLILISII